MVSTIGVGRGAGDGAACAVASVVATIEETAVRNARTAMGRI
jgi:hypothetical protein